MTICMHCHREIEDRGHPVARNGNFEMYSIWAHVPGGYLHCYPQQGPDSPTAEPWDGEDPPYDWR